MEDYENSYSRNRIRNRPQKKRIRKRPQKKKTLEEAYIYVTGLEENATEKDIRTYFTGLDVVDVFFHVTKRKSALVKFAWPSHTAAALKFNSKKRPLKLQLVYSVPWLKYAIQDKEVNEQGNKPGSPAGEGTCSCYIRVMNLPYCATKEDLKKIVVDRETEDSQIAFLTSEGNCDSKEAFIELKSTTQLQQSLKKNLTTFLGREIYIFPSSEGQLRQVLKDPSDLQIIKTLPSQEEEGSIASSKRTCIYVRNFPADVSKSDVQTFFSGFHVSQEDIFLLFDETGGGMGEALVKFPHEEVAKAAEGLHLKPFLGTHVLLLRISEGQMKCFDDLLQKGM